MGKKNKKESEEDKDIIVEKDNLEDADSVISDNIDDEKQGKSDDSEEDKKDNPKESKRKKVNKKERKNKKKKTSKEEEKPEDINIVKELLSLIIYIGIVVLLCYFIINFVGCRSRVDGSSMETTLSDGDNLWVDKLSYTFGKPKRFDVIIFNYDEDTTYVKRVIGLPGETVRIDQDGNIYINDQLLKENYGKEKILPSNLGRASQPVLLGEGEYFVLGDNRNNSSDSRWADVGNVQEEDIVGKVVLRIYPFSGFGTVK